MGYILDKLKKRGGKYYIIDWIFDIILAITFIYLSLQTREYILKCSCPTYNFTIIKPNLTNVTIPNLTNFTVGK